MTTSEPQAGRRDDRDDDPREHRTIGQRIRDAVLGEEPAGTRGDHAEPDRAGYTDAERGASTEPDRVSYTDAGRGAYTESDRSGAVDPAPPADRGGAAGYADPAPAAAAPGTGTGTEQAVGSLTSEQEAGYTDRTAEHADTPRDDAGYADTDRGVYTDTRTADARAADAGHGGAVMAETGHAETGYGYAERLESPRDDAPGRDVRDDALRDDTLRDDTGRDDALRDNALRDDTLRADSLRDDTGRDDDASVTPFPVGDPPAGRDPVRDDVTEDRTPRTADAGYADTGYAGTGATSGGTDFVTSSYDPDRDAGYDPRAAGTALADPPGAPAAGGGDLREPDTRPGGTDEYGARDYDPAADAGYVDEGRADVDRTTGDRDADYDTGRVAADPPGTDATATHHAAAAGTAGAVAAGGAAAAAGVVGAHHRQDDRDTRFSDVDDTSTVDATPTGRSTDEPAAMGPATLTEPTEPGGVGGEAAVEQRAEAVAADDEAEEDGTRERLVPADRADDYSTRWDALKGDFVDEPRRAVAQADDLVGELLDEIQRLFADQRRDLEQGFDHDRASTEDLRLALRRYRSFFDRLLSF